MNRPLPPHSDARLSDPQYRAEMLAKVEALISVLEVARAKVLANLEVRGSDRIRLARVRSQVENTLQVCRRARTALRGDRPITRDDILATDIDALCARLAQAS